MNTEDLKNFIEEHNINAEILELGTETKTARQAAEALGVGINQIVKSIVLTDGKEGILVVLRGSDKIDMKKLYNYTGKTWRMAKPDEVEKLSGYKIGAVPPISTNLKVIVDSSLEGVVYCGGGSERHLLKIDVDDIVKFTDAEILDVKKFNSSF